jgi:inorganic pyrophosphatase/Zn-dependent peptidase ImmA (M78 family)/transcriptional regulator with XRE-family HTH domain
MMTPSRLILARKRRGYTLARLGELADLSARSVSLYENGHAHPSAATLRRLADVLGVREAFLEGPDTEEIPTGAVSFRAISKMTARQRDQALSAGRVALVVNEWFESRFTLPSPDVPTLTAYDPESAAEVVRARWGLGTRPVTNMLHLVEAHGVRVYSLTRENKELDAFSLYWDGHPFAFLSTGKSGERGRFDVAHELGHLVLHGEHEPLDRPDAEVEANRFAAAFLMPRSTVLAAGLRHADVDRILAAKSTWKVSALALTHRLAELGLLTEWGYRTACVNLARLGYRAGEPDGIPRESSQLLAKVFRQLRDRGETLPTVAAAIGIGADELRAHVFGLTLTAVAPARLSRQPTFIAKSFDYVLPEHQKVKTSRALHGGCGVSDDGCLLVRTGSMRSGIVMEIDVIVEIPQGSRNKYEMDHATGRIKLDRMLFTSTRYPLDYGFIPGTHAGDGDPLDALVLLEEPTFPGCVILARPVAVFWMYDEQGPDAKILTVPAGDPRMAGIRDLADVPAHLTAEIGHFFDIYKELEPGKGTDVRGWQGRAEAEKVIEAARLHSRVLSVCDYAVVISYR